MTADFKKPLEEQGNRTHSRVRTQNSREMYLEAQHHGSHSSESNPLILKGLPVTPVRPLPLPNTFLIPWWLVLRSACPSAYAHTPSLAVARTPNLWNKFSLCDGKLGKSLFTLQGWSQNQIILTFWKCLDLFPSNIKGGKLRFEARTQERRGKVESTRCSLSRTLLETFQILGAFVSVDGRRDLQWGINRT